MAHDASPFSRPPSAEQLPVSQFRATEQEATEQEAFPCSGPRSLDQLPDGPLQLVASLVPPSSRNSLRLVCKRLHAFEAHTRSRLVFRFPRVAPIPSSPRASSSLSGRTNLGRNVRSPRAAESPRARSLIDDETEGQSHFRQVPLVPHSPAVARSSVTPGHDGDLPTQPAPLPLLEDCFGVEERHPRALASLEPSQSAAPAAASCLASQSQSARPSTAEGPVANPTPSASLNVSHGTRVGQEISENFLPAQNYPSDAESSLSCHPRKQYRVGLPFPVSDGELSEDDLSSHQPVPVNQSKRQRVHPGTLLRASELPPIQANRPPDTICRNSLCAAGSSQVHADPSQSIAPDELQGPSVSRTASVNAKPTRPGQEAARDKPSADLGTAELAALLPPSSSSILPGSPCVPLSRRDSHSRAALQLVDEAHQPRPGPVPCSPEDSFTAFLKRCPSLRSISVFNVPGGSPSSADGKLLFAIAELVPNLEELHISGQALGCTVSDTGLAAVARGCPQLHKLVVHHWVVGRDGMAALADMGKLRELEMDFFARDQGAGPHRTVAEVARCTSLTSLHLRYCNNDDVRALAGGCRSLRRLTLLFSVLGSSLSSLGLHCGGLRELTLRSCDATAPDDPLLSLAEHCTSLQSLSLHAGHAASEEGLRRLAQRCPGLTRLSLEFNPLPFRLAGMAQHLGGLRELSLQWVQVDDADLVAIGEHCKRLTMLVISLLHNVTDAGVSALLDGCGRGLEILLLRVKDASDAVVRGLGTWCPRLQRLTLGLPRLTNAGLSSMLQGSQRTQLRHLCRLRLWDCSALTDDALDIIGEHCPNLEGFGVKGCSDISEAKILSLLETCRKLDHFELESRLLSPVLREKARTYGLSLVECSP